MRLLFSTLILLSFSIRVAAEDREDPGLQQLAIESYVHLHRVPEAEAARRLRVQDRAAGIDDRLEALLGADYAGAWFNHEARGRLEIGMTRSGRARAVDVQRIVDEYALGDDVALIDVRFSLAELQRTKLSIRDSASDMLRIGHLATGYDPSINSVVVMTLSVLPSYEEARIREIANQDGVVVRRVDSSTLTGRDFDFGYIALCRINRCNPPMRGGRGVFSCTAGFTARHRVNTSDLVLLTAGHCIDGNWDTTWQAANVLGTPLNIGPSYGYVHGGFSGTDAGAIYIDPAGSWSTPEPEPWVLVEHSAQTTYDPKYAIEDDAASVVGSTLCYSGRTTLTNCAQVWMLGYDYVDSYGELMFDAGLLWPCTAGPGDSGAPIYKVHRGHGLLKGAVNGSNGGCFTSYQGIRKAENELNVDILEAN